MRVRKKYIIGLAVTFNVMLFSGMALAGGGIFELGGEVFNDRYREPNLGDNSVDSHANYGSLTGGYKYIFANHLFAALEGRASYGENDYKDKMPLGAIKVNNVPQYEGETRLLGGENILISGNEILSPYIGIGERMYFDRGKGEAFGSYDRHINQTYLPIGVTFKYKAENHWTFSPNLELDRLIYGRVSTRLAEVPGFYNTTNNQHTGLGVRGEFMFGQQMNNYAWQFGPFFRYWDIKRSSVATTPSTIQGNHWIEPDNNRLQLGLALRFLF